MADCSPNLVLQETVLTTKKWVLVTGGARGIGAGIVRWLTHAGYSVAFTYLSSDDAAIALALECACEGGWCRGFRCDMSDDDAVSKLCDALCAEFSPPYAIINNAGITRDSLIFMMSQEKWREVISTNLDSAYNLIHALVPKMIENQDGCIVNISSVTALKGNSGQANYGASKAALIGMSKSLAVELGRFNIRINVVAPGLIETEMTDKIPEPQKKKMISNVPLGCLGSVEDVSRMIEFLLGAGGRYVTGQTFVVDGGLIA